MYYQIYDNLADSVRTNANVAVLVLVVAVAIVVVRLVFVSTR